MDNTYKILKDIHQAEVNALPIKFAFGKEQFKKCMDEWGLKEHQTDKLYGLGDTGGFYLRSDAEGIQNTFKRHSQELKMAIAENTNGTFVVDMFSYELNNHEYGYTRDLTDTLQALDLTLDEIKQNKVLSDSLDKAIEFVCRDNNLFQGNERD
jgi:hypothetical protein